MFLKKPSYKRFEYLPRYYDPAKEERESSRRRIKFERITRRGNNKPFIIILIMFILALLLYSIFH